VLVTNWSPLQPCYGPAARQRKTPNWRRPVQPLTSMTITHVVTTSSRRNSAFSIPFLAGSRSPRRIPYQIRPPVPFWEKRLSKSEPVSWIPIGNADKHQHRAHWNEKFTDANPDIEGIPPYSAHHPNHRTVLWEPSSTSPLRKYLASDREREESEWRAIPQKVVDLVLQLCSHFCIFKDIVEELR
jgi:hypothetical protein